MGEASSDSATKDSGDDLRVRIRRAIWGARPYVPQKTYAAPAMRRDAGLSLQSHLLGVSQRCDGGVDLDVCRFRGMADGSLSPLNLGPHFCHSKESSDFIVSWRRRIRYYFGALLALLVRTHHAFCVVRSFAHEPDQFPLASPAVSAEGQGRISSFVYRSANFMGTWRSR
jgi:hypothetical protein